MIKKDIVVGLVATESTRYGLFDILITDLCGLLATALFHNFTRANIGLPEC